MKAANKNAETSFVCDGCGAKAESGTFCGHCGGTLRKAPVDDSLVGSKIGPYLVESVLGEGGMGKVYKGVHPTIGSRVAIKVLSAACAEKPDLVERFFAEARAVNLIRHESIVNVLDLSHLDDSRPYIVMEYLDGAPLSEILSKGPLPLGSAARLASEILGALAAAHAKGIVHRDLKPDNIFVSPQGRAKVLDFGIAKLMPEISGAATPTQTGALLGTPHYMSPEQALAQPIDLRSDIYSMGHILYECVTGSRAFDGESLYQLLHLQVHVAPRPPRQTRPDLSEAYERIILDSLHKDPAQRIPNANDFIRRLSEVSENLTAEAWLPIGTARDPSSARIAAMATPSGAKSPARGRGGAQLSPSQPTDPRAATVASSADVRRHLVPRPEPKGGKKLIIAASVVLLAAAGTTAALVGKTGSAKLSAGAQVDGDGPTPAPADGNASNNEGSQGAAPPEGKAVNAAGDSERVEAKADTSADGKLDKTEAAKHGVQIGDNVYVGSNDADAAAGEKAEAEAADKSAEPSTGSAHKLPKTIAITGIGYQSFDVVAYLPKATTMARRLLADAKFFRLDADGVKPNGMADFTAGSGFDVTYRFMSPSAAKRPKDLALGLPFKPNCLIYVTISPRGSGARVLEGWQCPERPQRAPGCDFGQVWEYAKKHHKAPHNAVANISYYGFRGTKAKYSFSISGTKVSGWVPANCRKK